jgi:hypothetical protein
VVRFTVCQHTPSEQWQGAGARLGWSWPRPGPCALAMETSAAANGGE